MHSLARDADLFITDVQPKRAVELGIDSETVGKAGFGADTGVCDAVWEYGALPGLEGD